MTLCVNFCQRFEQIMIKSGVQKDNLNLGLQQTLDYKHFYRQTPMNTDLMLDTLTTLMDRSQTQIQQILTKNKPLSSKIKYISLNILQLKYELLQWLINAIQQAKRNPSILSQIQQLKSSTFSHLSQLKLHSLLKSKFNRLKKQSFLNSTLNQNQSQSFQYNYDNSSTEIDGIKLNALEQSVILLEKDLNIHEQQLQDFNVSAIIQRTKLALHQENYNNISSISQSFIFTDQKVLNSPKNIKALTKNQIFSLQNQQFLKKDQQLISKSSQKFDQTKNSQVFNNKKSFQKQEKVEDNILLTKKQEKNLNQNEQLEVSRQSVIFENKVQKESVIFENKVLQRELKEISQRKKNKIQFLGIKESRQGRNLLKGMKKKSLQKGMVNNGVKKQDLLGSLLEQTYNEECL